MLKKRTWTIVSILAVLTFVFGSAFAPMAPVATGGPGPGPQPPDEVVDGCKITYSIVMVDNWELEKYGCKKDKWGREYGCKYRPVNRPKPKWVANAPDCGGPRCWFEYAPTPVVEAVTTVGHGHPSPKPIPVVEKCLQDQYAYTDLPNDVEECCGPNWGNLTPEQMQPGPKEISFFGRITVPCAFGDDTFKVDGIPTNIDWKSVAGQWTLKNDKASFADARQLWAIGGTDAPFSTPVPKLDEKGNRIYREDGSVVMIFKAAEKDPETGKYVLTGLNHAAVLFASPLEGEYFEADFTAGKYTRVRDAGITVKKFDVEDWVGPL